jgi:hypothetical protein
MKISTKFNIGAKKILILVYLYGGRGAFSMMMYGVYDEQLCVEKTVMMMIMYT